MNKRISVIMGVYNCAETIVEALDSIYAQTYKNFSLIVCDDASQDNTYEIVREYAQHHDNIVLLKNETNLKLAATLNHCLKYADTEYIARMDGDDISLPSRFEKEIHFLDTHPEYSFVSCPMIYFDEGGVWKTGTAIENPTSENFTNGPPFCHAPSMMRFTELKEVGFYTSEPRVERVEDYYLWYKFYKKNKRGYNLQEPLYKMRNDKNAFRRRRFKNRLAGFFINLEVCKGLGIPFPYFHSLKNFSKAFVPPRIQRFLIKLQNI